MKIMSPLRIWFPNTCASDSPIDSGQERGRQRLTVTQSLALQVFSKCKIPRLKVALCMSTIHRAEPGQSHDQGSCLPRTA